MKKFRYLENTVTLCYNENMCIGCGNCVIVCPHRVFSIENGKAAVMDHDGCMECGACSLNCPSEALFVRPGVGCAQAILHGWISKVPFLGRIFSPDSCCS